MGSKPNCDDAILVIGNINLQNVLIKGIRAVTCSVAFLSATQIEKSTMDYSGDDCVRGVYMQRVVGRDVSGFALLPRAVLSPALLKFKLR